MPHFRKLRKALYVLASVPEANFDLLAWSANGRKTSCKTVACAAGWLIRHPDFQVPGYRLSASGAIEHISESGRTGFDYAAKLFSLPYLVAKQLFGVRGNRMDVWLFGSKRPATDRELFFRRVQAYLEAPEDVTRQLLRL